MSAKKVWVTKYALTTGIRQCSVKSVSDGYTYVAWTDSVYSSVQCKNGRDCFDTEHDANARAYEMAQAKLKSLKRAMMRMEQFAEKYAARPAPPDGEGGNK